MEAAQIITRETDAQGRVITIGEKSYRIYHLIRVNWEHWEQVMHGSVRVTQPASQVPQSTTTSKAESEVSGKQAAVLPVKQAASRPVKQGSPLAATRKCTGVDWGSELELTQPKLRETKTKIINLSQEREVHPQRTNH